MIFGSSSLADGTVEAALNAVGLRLEAISQRVPLWVLPEYIRKQDEPNAEAMGKVIDALCAANSISSKGDTETRGNKVREIGETLLATPGLALAMAKYIKPIEFENAFQQYVDDAKPELKKAAERMGGPSHTYCDAVKKRFVATSGWLWKRGDTEAVLEEVYSQTKCAEHVRELAGMSGYMEFDDALNCLHRIVFNENKVPINFWAKKYSALQRFFELLRRPSLSGDDVKSFERIFTEQGQVIREIFFDITQVRQFDAMQEIFGEIWPASNIERRALYDALPQDSASFDEQSFKSQGRVAIDEFRRRLASTQASALWRRYTDTETPIEWSRKHGLPAECVLGMDDAKSIIDAVISPGNLSAERLHALHDELKRENVFLDAATAREKFLKRILPARYLKIGFNTEELSDWLRREIGNDPNSWLTNAKLHNVVEKFVKQRYDTQVRKVAADKVNALSDTDAKILLLKLIDEIPDVGLSTLE